MKKITTYLFCLMAVILILVSSTGISFVIHHCSDNNTSELHLFTSDYECDHEKPDNCCHAENEENSHQSTDNCCISKNHKCCSNTKAYFKVTDIYDFSRNQFNFNTELYTSIKFCKLIDIPLSYKNYYHTFYSPPLLHCGQDILIQISQFII